MARRKRDLEQLQQAVAEAEVSEASDLPIEPEVEPQIEPMAEPFSEPVAGNSLAEPISMEQLGLEEHHLGSETEDIRLRAMVEAAVYITDEPLLPEQIATALAQPIEKIQSILNDLVAEFALPQHGLALRELAGGYQMGTKAEHHEDLRQFVKKLQPPLKLSLAALETLAVIAYKQPVTAPEILEIRGVSGAGVLKTLLDRKLVQIAGRKAVLGKPALYRTTKEFLVQFGLKSLSELPTLKEFEELSRLALGDETAEVEQGELDLDAVADEAEGQAMAQADAVIDASASTPANDETPATEESAASAADTSEESQGEAIAEVDAAVEAGEKAPADAPAESEMEAGAASEAAVDAETPAEAKAEEDAAIASEESENSAEKES